MQTGPPRAVSQWPATDERSESCRPCSGEKGRGGKCRGLSQFLVGAAGFEPTTSLEFRQGALTTELYAYSRFCFKPTVSIVSPSAQGSWSRQTVTVSIERPVPETSGQRD